MFITTEDMNTIESHAEFIGLNVSEEAESLFWEDYNRSPILALYLANNDYHNRQHMIESIVQEAISNSEKKEFLKDTMYDLKTNFYTAARINKNGSHTIKVNTSAYEEFTMFEDIEAYHITSKEWSLLNQYLQDEITYLEEDENPEDSQYNVKTFSNVNDIYIENCYAGETIGANSKIEGNRFTEDCDTYGSTYGAKAQEAFIFWITEQNEYAVIYHEYWCM